MINSKKKGNIWENRLANWLRDNGIKAWKDSQSGGGNREKGDVGNNIDCTIESKAAKNIKLMEWWEQVSHSASLHRNSPLLFIHQDGMSQDNWLVVMNSNDWLELVLKKPEEKIIPQENQNEDREQKWAIQNLITSAKKVIKFYEK